MTVNEEYLIRLNNLAKDLEEVGAKQFLINWELGVAMDEKDANIACNYREVKQEIDRIKLLTEVN